MTEFEFDRAPSPGSNRSSAVTDCDTCGGDRMVEVEDAVYARCSACNAPSTPEREPIPDDAWWKR